MSITSLSFGLFLLITVIVYYTIPYKHRWMWLLTASIYFYALSGTVILYVLGSSLSIYTATILIGRTSNNVRKKIILCLTLLLNFGVLAFFKYINFGIEQINAVGSLLGNGIKVGKLNLIVPMGISFYTFQSVGYLMDVYWGKIEYEKNWAKLLLFMLFFPHITQGPISDYKKLADQFYGTLSFNIRNYSFGCKRIIWGLFKKMVIADVLAVYVSEYFNSYNEYSGVGLLIGIFMYSIQLYADFSGYMDIMCGFCEILGITLEENFSRPYFSTSVAEYWRRWHITLGAWFRNYLYYPINYSLARKKWQDTLRLRYGKKVAKRVAPTISLLVVWLATGLWHGASWGFVAWGLLNGLIIIAEMWLEKTYEKIRRILRIRETSYRFKLFRMVRTYIITTVILSIPFIGSLSDAVLYYKRLIFCFADNLSMHSIIPQYTGLSTLLKLTVCGVGIVLFLTVSIMQERGSAREQISNMNLLFRWGIYILLAVMILVFGTAGGGEAFLYAQF